MKITKDSIYEIEPPILYNGAWNTRGAMFNVLEYGMVIARCPNLEIALRIVKSLLAQKEG